MERTEPRGPRIGHGRCPQTCNPITFSSGNKYYQENDLTLAAPGLPFGFTRHYNSQSTTEGPLGYGWSATFSDHLTFGENSVTLHEADATVVVFVADGNGSYLNNSNLHSS